MSILLYCVAAKCGLPPPDTGVADLPILSSEQDDLVALFSEGASSEAWTGAPMRESARQFHRILQRAFEAGAIIPFRFPTLMRDRAELETHLRENSDSYASLLLKFQDSAQMEAVISYSGATHQVENLSGTDYLRDRQRQSEELEATAAKLQNAVGNAAIEWRYRSIHNRLRVFALLSRDAVAAFKENLTGFPVAPGLTVRVTGPWPVTEFFEANTL